ncbi:hypothetical protein GCM10007989_12960 [Devosia pacifica]|uniref:Uncharacterized protein n=1 Tax=Devosia pacifica TaxID=1335967 RepID=A0A918S1B9_9HYPH|nr:hypothetical protein GCM10007989_12960 [Devosia pacifica]
MTSSIKAIIQAADTNFDAAYAAAPYWAATARVAHPIGCNNRPNLHRAGYKVGATFFRPLA